MTSKNDITGDTIQTKSVSAQYRDNYDSIFRKPMLDENTLPITEQSLVFRLRKRAEIRRQISSRKSVEEGKPDRIADLLEEAAVALEKADAIKKCAC